MDIKQYTLTLQEKPRGFHLITDEILSQIDISNIKVGTLHLFLQHTSASLSINENCEREVRTDLENLLNEIADNKPYYTHTYEGDDDMPAHSKSSLLGVSLTIPITNGKLNLGTWQGIYLVEHRYNGGSRTISITITGI
jgi:secondary thiamine-phosphate synthase enzyme